ncbi:serine/threonine-protein kinase [Streptomyces uncialis]|uniref:serine/threonine-protein kinase n=1 Tax=Streptomyces uncialis TaxID=1048205 RepID=UPI0033C3B7D6
MGTEGDSTGVSSRVIGGRYRLRTRLGRGGMGIVWGADDELLGRPVAVKELLSGDTSPGAADRWQRARTLREARAVARLRHPAIVVVHDVVEDGDGAYIVMELVEGRSLADRIDGSGPVDPAEAARIGVALLGALSTAHEAGVLHRDIKPDNVLLEARTGRVVLTDFGVARVPGARTLTEDGLFVGSPEYTAPERMSGSSGGPEADLWSLGALLCAALSGRSLFRRDSISGTLHAVVVDEIRPPAEAGPLLPVVSGLLERDPGLRLHAQEAERLLHTYLATSTPPGAAPLSSPPPSDGAVASAPPASAPPGAQAPGSAPPGAQAPGSAPPGAQAPGSAATGPVTAGSVVAGLPGPHAPLGEDASLSGTRAARRAPVPSGGPGQGPPASPGAAPKVVATSVRPVWSTFLLVILAAVMAGAGMSAAVLLYERGRERDDRPVSVDPGAPEVSAPGTPSTAVTAPTRPATSTSAPVDPSPGSGGPPPYMPPPSPTATVTVTRAPSSAPMAVPSDPSPVRVPIGYRRVDAEGGLSLAVPQAYTRRDAGHWTLYASPDGAFRVGVRVATAEPGGPVEALRRDHDRGRDRKGAVTPTTHRGHPAGIWESASKETGKKGGGRFGVDLAWQTDAHLYNVMVMGPAAREAEVRSHFATVRGSTEQ